MNKVDVLIIGAGFAGLGAARTIQRGDKKLKTVIVEARNRVGGRVRTEKVSNTFVDFGACWFHGTQGHSILDELKKYFPEEYQQMKIVPSHQVINYDPLEKDKKMDMKKHQQFNSLFKNMTRASHVYAMRHIFKNDKNQEPESNDLKAQESRDMSVEEFFQYALNQDEKINTQYKKLLNKFGEFECKRWLNYFKKEISGYYAMDLDDLSLGFIMDPEDTTLNGGNHVCSLGIQKCSEILAKGMPIRFGQTVKRIDIIENEKRVLVHVDVSSSLGVVEQKIYDCKHVVLTVPLGVLKKDHIVFNPPLGQIMPKKKAAIDKFEMGNLEKVILHFNKRFWGGNQFFIDFVQSNDDPHGHYEFFFAPGAPNGDSVLCGFVHGKYARELSDLSDEQIGEISLAKIRNIVGEEIMSDVKLIDCKFTRWYKDPLAGYGSYVACKKGSLAYLYDWLSTDEDSRNLLYFAGEGTSRENGGMIQGAYDSGVLAATRILNIQKATQPT